MIEVIVVVVILAILAVIAVPNFLESRANAQDAQAKAVVSAAAKAAYAYNTGADDGFTGLNASELHRIEPSLAPGQQETVTVSVLSASTTAFEVQAVSKTGNTFLLRGGDAGVTRRCESPGKAACPSSGRW